MKYYEFKCKICGEVPAKGQQAVSFYGQARLATACYRHFARHLYEEEHLPFYQMIFPYTELSGLLGGADGYLVSPGDPFVVMAQQQDLPRLKAAAEKAFREAAADFLGRAVPAEEAGDRLFPLVQMELTPEGEPCPPCGENPGGEEALRRLLHQSPLTRPLWDYLSARQGRGLCFDGLLLPGGDAFRPHYEWRQWAGKLLAAGETASRVIRRVGGFVLTAGGSQICWLCPPETAPSLQKKLADFTGELRA